MDLLQLALNTASTTVLVGVLAWLSKNWITVRLTNSVSFIFNKKIEDIKSDLRIKEDQIRQELNSKGKSIELLQSGFVNQALSRNAEITAKKITAVEELWKAVHQLSPQKNAAKIMQGINFDFASKAAPTDPNLREMFSVMNKTFKVNEVNVTANVIISKLYVSDLTWAYYSAYTSIIMVSVTKMIIIETGVGNLDLLQTNEISDMVVAVLPHQKKFIEERGIHSLDFLVEEVESKVLESLRRELYDVSASEGAAKQAKEIAELSEQIRNKLQLINKDLQ